MSNQHKAIYFNKFTPESMSKIRESILNEKLRLEIEKTDADFDNVTSKLKKTKKKGLDRTSKEIANKTCPNKDFETGKKLPNKYKQLIGTKLFGTPIEEVDTYYKNDYVIILI